MYEGPAEPKATIYQYIVPRTTASTPVEARAVSSTNRLAGYVVGCVFIIAGLLATIALLVYMVWRRQKERRLPLISPIYPAPMSEMDPRVSERNAVHPLNPQRLSSPDRSVRRSSTHKSLFLGSRSLYSPPLHNDAALEVVATPPLASIPPLPSAPPLPSPPPRTHAGSRPSTARSWATAGSIAANFFDSNRGTFLSGISTRAMSFLPRYQRSYVPPYSEDVPPAYQG